MLATLYQVGKVCFNFLETNGFHVLKVKNERFTAEGSRSRESLKPAAHLRKELSKLSYEAVCSAFSSRVQGNFGEEFASRGREDKIKHIWYFGASEANSSLLRQSWESSWARSTKHPIEYMAFSLDFSGSRWRQRKKRDATDATWECHVFHCMLDWPSTARFSQWPHTVRNLPRLPKNIKHVWFYPHDLARRIPHQNFPAHVTKRLSNPPREAVCSALSSPCVASLKYENSTSSFGRPHEKLQQ